MNYQKEIKMSKKALQEITEKDIIQIIIEDDENKLYFWFNHHFLDYSASVNLTDYYDTIKEYKLNVVCETYTTRDKEGNQIHAGLIDVETSVENVQHDKDVLIEAIHCGLEVKIEDLQPSPKKLTELSAELKKISKEMIESVRSIGYNKKGGKNV